MVSSIKSDLSGKSLILNIVMRNMIALLILVSVSACNSKWEAILGTITYEDLEKRPVSLCLDGEKFMTEKDKREMRDRIYKIPKSACASLTKTENGMNFYYVRNIPADCDFADSLRLALIYNNLPFFPETGVKYVRKDPEFNNWPSMPRIDFWVDRGGRNENIATESWIQFTEIDTLNKVVSGFFEFNARNKFYEDRTYSVTDGTFENIPLIYN